MGNNTQEMLKPLQELQQIDQNICKIGHEIIKFITSERSSWTHNNKSTIEKNLRIVGSFSENTGIARFFKTNESFPDHLNRECELDLEFTICEIPEFLKEDLIVELPEKKGFVNLQLKTNIEALKTLIIAQGWDWKEDNELEQKVKETITKEGFLQPYKTKNILLDQAKFTATEQIEIIIAFILGKSKENISINLHEEITSATAAVKVEVEVDKKLGAIFCLDYVTLIRLEWWPSIGDEWKYRSRKWPEQQCINKIATNGCIIAKPFDTTDIESTEFRYSFGHVEQELVGMRSPHQNLVYLVFKAIFYKRIKPINEEMLSSYIVKTTMLWTCEEFPPEHQMWKEDFPSMIKALYDLFTKLLYALNKGYLEYYFIKNVNIIKDMSPKVTNEVIAVVQQILDELNKNKTQLPIQIDREVKFGQEFLKLISKTLDIFKEIEEMEKTGIVGEHKLLEEYLSQRHQKEME